MISKRKMLLLLELSLLVILEAGDGAFHLNITEGCKLIFPPWDGGIRYRGLTREQVKMARFLPFDYEIEYVCRPEREIVGPKVRKCLPNGTWTDSDVESRCLRTCPKMHLSLENGQAHARAIERVPVEGTWVEYRCNTGFHLVGSPRSNCTKAGRWSSAKPVCESPTLGSAMEEPAPAPSPPRRAAVRPGRPQQQQQQQARSFP
ncbi:gamma-aminobutyric acid type B receptor subunit 1-like [Heteronotia binoei]|uniref:gamma-aminobutyric acid type B receptor subunit 1-like n=1 Tax=Heteronotia binoei TaxID=13085 RepID=UPI00292CE1D7|nr:gamma-aminobutyric acid type B receptor subunit 1-like [Heteronotia binoei]